MENQIRCIYVGMGAIGSIMVPYLQEKPWFTTVAAVDVRDEALAKAGQVLGLPEQALFNNLEEAISRSQADAVIVNTPSEYHYEQAKQALQAGLHVLVAKPITNNYEQAAELVALAAERGLTLSVGQQVRYFRHYQAVKRFLESGRLGSVEVINYLNTKPRHQALNLGKMDQPALYEMSCHHFDCLMALTADDVPQEIFCDGFRPSWSVYSGPCMVNAVIRFQKGIHVLYHAGFSSQASNYELRLEGSQGVLRCQGIHMSVDTMTNEFAERGGKFGVVDIDSDLSGGQPFGQFFDYWYDYLTGGKEPPFSGRNNLKVFALLSAAIDSIQTNRLVSVADNPRYAAAFQTEGEWSAVGDR